MKSRDVETKVDSTLESTSPCLDSISGTVRGEFSLQKSRFPGAGGHFVHLSTLLSVNWSGEENGQKNTGVIRPPTCGWLLLSLGQGGWGSLGMWGHLPFSCGMALGEIWELKVWTTLDLSTTSMWRGGFERWRRDTFQRRVLYGIKHHALWSCCNTRPTPLHHAKTMQPVPPLLHRLQLLHLLIQFQFSANHEH